MVDGAVFRVMANEQDLPCKTEDAERTPVPTANGGRSLQAPAHRAPKPTAKRTDEVAHTRWYPPGL